MLEEGILEKTHFPGNEINLVYGEFSIVFDESPNAYGHGGNLCARW